MGRGGTERLGEILTHLMQRRAYAQPLALAGWREAWARAAGERVAGRTRVLSFRDGTLTVEVGSAAQRYELEAFHGQELLAALQRDGSVATVRRIAFRTGTSRP
jgi:predicted nucleic acid-binding Zn ribbon protein